MTRHRCINNNYQHFRAIYQEVYYISHYKLLFQFYISTCICFVFHQQFNRKCNESSWFTYISNNKSRKLFLHDTSLSSTSFSQQKNIKVERLIQSERFILICKSLWNSLISAQFAASWCRFWLMREGAQWEAAGILEYAWLYHQDVPAALLASPVATYDPNGPRILRHWWKAKLWPADCWNWARLVLNFWGTYFFFL